jgi:hypothetical protein
MKRGGSKSRSYASSGGKSGGKVGGASTSTVSKSHDAGKMPNWDGKKQGPSKVNKGFGAC